MIKGMMTPALSCLQRARQQMRAQGLGEPAVQIPMEAISTCVSQDGCTLAFITMATMIELVEEIERRFPEKAD